MKPNLFTSIAPFIGASEFALTITLVVFVMLTAILLFIILLLCVSKSFRAFFFRDAAKRKKAAAKKNKQAAAANVDETATDETQPSKTSQKNTRSRRDAEAGEPQNSKLSEKPAKRNARATSKSKDSDIYDGVITVPLDFAAPVTNEKTSGKSNARRNASRDENTYDGDDVPTVALPRTTPQAQQSERKRVYTPRTVTITRARPSSESTQTQSAEKRDPQSNAQSRKKK